MPAVRLARELPYTACGWRKRWQPLTNTNVIKHVLLNHFARLNERSAQRYGMATVDYFIGVSYTAQDDAGDDRVRAWRRCLSAASRCSCIRRSGPMSATAACPTRVCSIMRAAPQRGTELAGAARRAA